MIGRQRRGENDSEGTLLGASLVKEDQRGIMAVPTPIGRFTLTAQKISLVVAVAVFAALLKVKTIPEVTANNCLAILVFSTIMWATEVRLV